MYVSFLDCFGFKDDTFFIRKNIWTNILYPTEQGILRYRVWLGRRLLANQLLYTDFLLFMF